MWSHSLSERFHCQDRKRNAAHIDGQGKKSSTAKQHSEQFIFLISVSHVRRLVSVLLMLCALVKWHDLCFVSECLISRDLYPHSLSYTTFCRLHLSIVNLHFECHIEARRYSCQLNDSQCLSHVNNIFFINDFQVGGIALMAVGGVALKKIGDVKHVFDDGDHPGFFPAAIIALGALVFVIAFFGCCGAIRESRELHFT